MIIIYINVIYFDEEILWSLARTQLCPDEHRSSVTPRKASYSMWVNFTRTTHHTWWTLRKATHLQRSCLLQYLLEFYQWIIFLPRRQSDGITQIWSISPVLKRCFFSPSEFDRRLRRTFPLTVSHRTFGVTPAVVQRREKELKSPQRRFCVKSPRRPLPSVNIGGLMGAVRVCQRKTFTTKLVSNRQRFNEGMNFVCHVVWATSTR